MAPFTASRTARCRRRSRRRLGSCARRWRPRSPPRARDLPERRRRPPRRTRCPAFGKSWSPQFTCVSVSLTSFWIAATVAAHLELAPQPPLQVASLASSFIAADASRTMSTIGQEGLRGYAVDGTAFHSPTSGPVHPLQWYSPRNCRVRCSDCPRSLKACRSRRSRRPEERRRSPPATAKPPPPTPAGWSIGAFPRCQCLAAGRILSSDLRPAARRVSGPLTIRPWRAARRPARRPRPAPAPSCHGRAP